MIWYTVPVVTFAIKKYISSKISDAVHKGIDEGVKTTKSVAINAIYKGLYASITNISINITLLIIAVYLMPMIAERNISIFIIANVYLASVIHGIWNIFIKIPIASKIILKYRLDFKSYLKDEIYNKVYSKAYYRASSEIEDTFILFKPFVYLFGDSPSEIAHRVAHSTSLIATEVIFHEVIKKASVMVIFVVVYYMAFRYVVAPFLLHDVTGMGVIDTLIYPFIFSIKYFASY
ncbi:hypothetical protein NG774_00735 [Aliarcobacter cryaerophilus]|uniref:hypothetical protein n=1 Tax=Aliarcobacter cryaerophilus TaxID=28198 RepID=UPI003DA1D5B9